MSAMPTAPLMGVPSEGRLPCLTRRRVIATVLPATVPVVAACAVGDGGGETRPAVKPGKFTFVTWWIGGHAMTPFTEEVGRRWRAHRPEIEVEFVPAAGAGAVPDRVITAAAAGTPVDASLVSGSFGRDLYDRGLLREIDSYLKGARDVADEKFVKGATYSRRAKGKTFGLPAYGPEGPVILVSSGAFQEAGLDPQGKNIQTWDDLTRIADRLTRRQGQEITRAGYQLSSLDVIRLTGWTHTTNTPLFNEDQTKAAYTGAGAVASMELLLRLQDGLRVSQPLAQPGRSSSDRALTSGVAAMADDLSSAPIRLRATPEFKYWMIPYPKGPGGRGPSSDTVVSLVALGKDARNPDQAFEFARWFCGDVDLQVHRLKLTQLNSPLLAFYQTAEWKAMVKELPAQATVLEIAQLAGPYPLRRFDDQHREITPLLRSALLGEIDAKNALQQAQTIADRLLQ